MEKYFLLNRVDFDDEGYIDVFEVNRPSEDIFDYPKLDCGGPVQLVKWDEATESIEILKTFIFTDKEMTNKLREANPNQKESIYAGYYFSMRLRIDAEPGLTFIDYEEYLKDYKNKQNPAIAEKNKKWSQYDSFYYSLNNLEEIKRFIKQHLGQSAPAGSQLGEE